MCNDKIGVISISSKSNIYHFFVVRMFKTLSSSYFEIYTYNTSQLTVVTTLYNRTSEIIPSNYNFVPIDQSFPILSFSYPLQSLVTTILFSIFMIASLLYST
jgi:AAA15 family ATPase/GTPase